MGQGWEVWGNDVGQSLPKYSIYPFDIKALNEDLKVFSSNMSQSQKLQILIKMHVVPLEMQKQSCLIWLQIKCLLKCYQAGITSALQAGRLGFLVGPCGTLLYPEETSPSFKTTSLLLKPHSQKNDRYLPVKQNTVHTGWNNIGILDEPTEPGQLEEPLG